jgi:FkbM family methyltransferase
MGLFKKKQKNTWSKTSYAQCGEDLIVSFIFEELRILRPSYIDVGAHHPFFLNNTALFYESGSNGINIEPDPSLFGEFLKYRTKDINLNLGIGSENGNADFYIISSPTLNTFSREAAENYKNEGNYFIKEVIRVPVDNIQNIVRDHFNGVFPDFLNLDAEGIDEMIVKSIDYQTNYPLVICVETVTFSTSGHGKKNTGLIEYIEAAGYYLYADTYINSIFVRLDRWRKKN